MEGVEDHGLGAEFVGSWLTGDPLVSLDDGGDVTSRRDEGGDGEEGRERLPHLLVRVRFIPPVLKVTKSGLDRLEGGVEELCEESGDDGVKMGVDDVPEHPALSETGDVPSESLENCRLIEVVLVECGGQEDGERPWQALSSRLFLRPRRRPTDLRDSILPVLPDNEEEVNVAELVEEHVRVLLGRRDAEERLRHLRILSPLVRVPDDPMEDGR